jgi:hypothetical protein
MRLKTASLWMSRSAGARASKGEPIGSSELFKLSGTKAFPFATNKTQLQEQQAD